MRDHLGSVRDVLDETGNPTARYDYDPYGNLIGEPTQKPEFGYAGMHYHAPSGLYLTLYRAYDPRDGRWLSRDPIEETGGINLYGYVQGNPLSYTDPDGLAAVGVGVGIGVRVIGGRVAAGAIGAAARRYGPGGMIAACVLAGVCTFDEPEVDPVPEQQPFNPGRDCTGKCNPCPFPTYWEAPGNKHGSTSGTHAHGIVWNQNPSTCMCYPRRVSGPSLGNTR